VGHGRRQIHRLELCDRRSTPTRAVAKPKNPLGLVKPEKGEIVLELQRQG
jgi:hypothetical protein